MEKYATNPLAMVRACDAFEWRPGVAKTRSADGAAVDKTCGSCSHYSTVTGTRKDPFCPFAGKSRPEDGQV